MSVEARPLEWHDLFGGGWTVDCSECGEVWTETTDDRDDLPRVEANAEAAALLHEDNGHAPIVADLDGQPEVAPARK